MRIATRLRGTLAVARALPAQRRIPFLPVEKAIELRNARVRAIVRHAADSIPYYRELFAREEIDPSEIRTVEQLRRLPLIDKAIVLADPERFRSTDPETRDAVPFTTSGSSWTPLTVFHDRRSLLAGLAHSERYRMVERAFVRKKVRWTVAMIAHGGTGRGVDAHHHATVARLGCRGATGYPFTSRWSTYSRASPSCGPTCSRGTEAISSTSSEWSRRGVWPSTLRESCATEATR